MSRIVIWHRQHVYLSNELAAVDAGIDSHCEQEQKMTVIN
jgi:hypothetical protein